MNKQLLNGVKLKKSSEKPNYSTSNDSQKVSQNNERETKQKLKCRKGKFQSNQKETGERGMGMEVQFKRSKLLLSKLQVASQPLRNSTQLLEHQVLPTTVSKHAIRLSITCLKTRLMRNIDESTQTIRQSKKELLGSKVGSKFWRLLALSKRQMEQTSYSCRMLMQPFYKMQLSSSSLISSESLLNKIRKVFRCTI